MDSFLVPNPSLAIEEMLASNDVAFQGFASTKFTYFIDDKPSATPQLLHVAALKGNAALVKAVLDYKVPVDVKDSVICCFLVISIEMFNVLKHRKEWCCVNL